MAGRTYGLFGNEANTRLIANFKEQNVDLLLLPEIVYNPVNAGHDIRLSEFDWVIFPDPLSVDFFLPRIENKFELDELRICALGEAISDGLRFSQLHADVIPPKVDPETVLNSLSEYQSPAGRRFLIPASLNAQPRLPDLLKENGAEVTTLGVYEAGPVPGLSRLLVLLNGGAVDEFIFSSPQDVFDLASLIDLNAMDFALSATDDRTFQTLEEFGSQPIAHK
jgi:uroporphyrinogen-III synthase